MVVVMEKRGGRESRSSGKLLPSPSDEKTNLPIGYG